MIAATRVEHVSAGLVHANQSGHSALRTLVSKPADNLSVTKNPVSGSANEKTNAVTEDSRTEELVHLFNKEMEQWGKHLRFRYNEEAEQTYVEVIDLETQEVIISLPPEYLIELSIKLKDIIGLFLDKKL